MPAIKGEGAGTFLLSFFANSIEESGKTLSNTETPDQPLLEGITASQQDEWVAHMLGNLPMERIEEGLSLVRRLTSSDRDRELRTLNLSLEAVTSGGAQPPKELVAWAGKVAEIELADAKALATTGQPLAIDWRSDTTPHWQKQVRRSTDGRDLSVSSSILLGESYTGTYQTSDFASPKSIEFWLAGHNGMPDQPDHQKNRVQLIDSSTGDVLREAFPPRSDVAKKVTWDCEAIAGRSVRIRCIDGDSDSAYAWLAIGQMQPNWLEPSADVTAVDRLLSMVQRFGLSELRNELAELASTLAHDPTRQTAEAATVARLDNRMTLATLLEATMNLAPASSLREKLVYSAIQSETCDEFLVSMQLSKLLTAQQQAQFAEQLSGAREQIEILVKLMQNGAMTPRVLLEKNLWDRVTAIGDKHLLATVEQLRAALPPVDEKLLKVVDAVALRVSELQYDKLSSEILYAKHCAVCHQLNGKGQVIGPQLDGIGARGPSRLAEDILLPDRNVDLAFRTTTFLTDEGRVLTGLIRDENDDRILIVGQDGKEFELVQDTIEQRRAGVNSLMPSNFHELMTVDELAGIIRYLADAAGQKQN